MKTKIFFFIISLTLVFGCGAKKTTIEYKEVIKKDTTYIFKEKKVFERVVDTFNIEQPCDSLGNLKPFKRSIVTPQGKISIEGINNVISANIDLKGYENTIERKYQLLYDKKISEISKEEIRYKIPLWSWLTHVICVLIIVLLLRFKF